MCGLSFSLYRLFLLTCAGFPSHCVDFLFPLVWALLGPSLLNRVPKNKMGANRHRMPGAPIPTSPHVQENIFFCWKILGVLTEVLPLQLLRVGFIRMLRNKKRKVWPYKSEPKTVSSPPFYILFSTSWMLRELGWVFSLN